MYSSNFPHNFPSLSIVPSTICQYYFLSILYRRFLLFPIFQSSPIFSQFYPPMLLIQCYLFSLIFPLYVTIAFHCVLLFYLQFPPIFQLFLYFTHNFPTRSPVFYNYLPIPTISLLFYTCIFLPLFYLPFSTISLRISLFRIHSFPDYCLSHFTMLFPIFSPIILLLSLQYFLLYFTITFSQLSPVLWLTIYNNFSCIFS